MLRKLIHKICCRRADSKLPLKFRARLYLLAKALGVIRVPEGKDQRGRPLPEPSVEDRLWAEAGLEDFVTHLAQEEEEASKHLKEI